MGSMSVEKVRYFLWALAKWPNHDLSCPFCLISTTHLIRRKAWVTSLWECGTCGLRFRFPKESVESSRAYYQSRYQQDLTSECPAPTELSRLIAGKFSGSEKDFRGYIEILKGLALQPGEAILDFGCSWGYGSWQFAQAGFEVYSYEISRPRAAYAQEQLHCRVVATVSDIPKKVKCFFSAHVIEHLPDPHVLWQAAAETLDSQGVMVTFCPNGEPLREEIQGAGTYHKLWGQKHPLLLNGRALKAMARRYGFTPYVFSSPYSPEEIRSCHEPEELTGEELLLVARRP